MKLDEYKSGDQVEVQMVNPQTDDIEWRAGKGDQKQWKQQ